MKGIQYRPLPYDRLGRTVIADIANELDGHDCSPS
jgi:hypothetical protein